MTESEPKKCQKLNALSKNDCNSIIQLRFRNEIEKRYSHKMQNLYKNSTVFCLINSNKLGNQDQVSLKQIANQTNKIAPFLTNLIYSVIFNAMPTIFC